MADSFHATYKDVMRALQDIQDNLMSQDSPGIDTATIGEQQKELEVRLNSRISLYICLTFLKVKLASMKIMVWGLSNVASCFFLEIVHPLVKLIQSEHVPS